MTVDIKIECDTIFELETHLRVLRTELKRIQREQGLASESEFKLGETWEDTNSYGWHQFRVVTH